MIEQHGPHRLYVGRCEELLELLDDASVDAVVTDPPYGMRGGGAAVCGREGNPLDLKWDHTMPLEYLPEMARVMRPGAAAIVFVEQRHTGTMWNAMEASGLGPRSCFYWVKPNPVPNPRKSFMSGVEVAIFARKPGPVLCWNGGGTSLNYWHGPAVHGVLPVELQGKLTPKPVQLIKHLIAAITDPGMTVLDLFLGSGTTLVGCHDLGRIGIGSELSPVHAAVARSRIGEAMAQLSLF